MTIQEALNLVDEMQPNTMSAAAKISFISELEGKIHREILMKHVHTVAEETCPTYNSETGGSTELLVKEPYHMVYVYWVLSRLDEQNREWDEFNNHRTLFKVAWDEFGDYWRREHMPITRYPRFII